MGKYHANLMSFQNRKNVCLSTETKKKLSSFVINYHSSAIKLSISATGLRQKNYFVAKQRSNFTIF